MAFAYLCVKAYKVTRSAFKPYRAYLSLALWVKRNSSSTGQLNVSRELCHFICLGTWSARLLVLSCLMYSRLLLVINVSCWANRVHLQSMCMSWNICLCKFCKENYPMSAVPYERTVYKIMEIYGITVSVLDKNKMWFFFLQMNMFYMNNMLMLGKSPCNLSSFLYSECIQYHSAYIF